MFALAAGIVPFTYPSVIEENASAETALDTASLTNESNIVATVGVNEATGTADLGNSWPAELISSSIVQVQPQREGTIVDWRVYVGETVAAGDVLGHISAPPATPELIAMLADQTQMVTEANAQMRVTDDYTAREKARYAELSSAIENARSATSTSLADASFPALASIRAQVGVQQSALRTVTEAAFGGQVAMVLNMNDWRYARNGVFNRAYGAGNQSVQNEYIAAIPAFAEALQKNTDVPIAQAQAYFALAVRVANSTIDDPAEMALNASFKTSVVTDQKDFLMALAEYRDAQMALADKETEYRLMIQEKSAMLVKDQSMAISSAEAAQTAYRTVAAQVNGGTAIVATRSGTVSAIYKKVGDLVGPEMPIATLSGYSSQGLTVRMHIPSTVQRPAVGDVLSVMRPGFPSDVQKVKLIGVGTSLDDTGSYMADALLIGSTNWPVSASVRVLAPKESGMTVQSSAVMWGEGGVPQVWAISSGGRIFAKKITVGRTLGEVTEVYGGLENGDRYIAKAIPDIHEDMLLDNLLKLLAPVVSDEMTSEESGGMGDMPM
ncbi:MAG: hypothetical protein WA053_01175 [Minisyncoccia bacterium]